MSLQFGSSSSLIGAENAQYETSLQEAMGANIDEQFLNTPLGSIMRWKTLSDIEESGGKVINHDELNKMYPGLPIPFSKPTNERVARFIFDQHQERLKRQDIINRAPKGFLSGVMQFGASMVPHIVDPLNILATKGAGYLFSSAFPALAGKTMAEAAAAGTMGRKLFAEFAEGMAGNLAAESIAVKAAQEDLTQYSPMDGFINALAPAILFPTVKLAGYKALQHLAKVDPIRADLAHNTAVAQMAEGKSINVEPIVRGADVEDVQFVSSKDTGDWVNGVNKPEQDFVALPKYEKDAVDKELLVSEEELTLDKMSQKADEDIKILDTADKLGKLDPEEKLHLEELKKLQVREQKLPEIIDNILACGRIGA